MDVGWLKYVSDHIDFEYKMLVRQNAMQVMDYGARQCTSISEAKLFMPATLRLVKIAC